jgi:hypothetical protein
MDDNSFKKSSLYPYIVGNPKLLSTKDIVLFICNKLNIDIKNIKFNEKDDFSRIVNISQLPFNFNYTNFKDAINELLDIYIKK